MIEAPEPEDKLEVTKLKFTEDGTTSDVSGTASGRAPIREERSLAVGKFARA